MTRAKEATRPAEEFPDPPEGWTPGGFNDPRGLWLRGLSEVDGDGADRSGPDKGLRIVRGLAWSIHLIGGSIHNWRRQLAEAQLHRQQAQGRLARRDRQGLNTTEATGETAGADRHIAALETLIKAAEAWPEPDNADLRQRLDAATQRHQERGAQIEPYLRARLPLPAGWEEDLFEAEKAVVATSEAFDAGRARLDALNTQLTEATAAAYQALAGALAHVEDRLGEACAKIIHEGDADFLRAFPNRSPDGLLALHDRAIRVNGIMAGLGAQHDAGMARFWRACGEVVTEIVARKCELGRSITPEMGPGLASNRIMQQTF